MSTDSTAPAAPFTPNLGQRIARASWWACFVGILLNVVAGMLKDGASSPAQSVSLLSLALVGVGFVLGVIALLGMGRWGREDVLRPALVGIALALAMVGLTAKSVITARHQASDRERAVAEEREKVAQLEREAFMESGWFGLHQAGGVVLTLSSMPGSNPVFSAMLSNLRTDASLLLVIAQNHTRQEAVVDTAGAMAGLQDGKQQAALDAVPILEGAQHDREKLMRAYSPPLRIPAGRAVSTLVFMPAATDWRSVQSVSLIVDGGPQMVRGQFLTKEQKQQLFRAATQPATPLATQPP